MKAWLASQTEVDEKFSDLGSDRMRIHALVIHPDYRRQQYGRKLLE